MAQRDGGIPTVVPGTLANANGLRIIAQASKYIGVVESPALTNHGKPHPYDWQDNFHIANLLRPPMLGEPGYPSSTPSIGPSWCGCFAASMYVEAGVDDMDVGDPSVKNIWNKAQALKPSIGTTIPVTGCYVIFGEWDSSGNITVGHHVELFVRWHSIGRRQIVTIGGNTPIDDADTNDGVVCKVRSILAPIADTPAARLKFVVPPSITKLDKVVSDVGSGLHPIFSRS